MNRKTIAAVVWMVVLTVVYLAPLATVSGASPPQPVPNVAPQFSEIQTWYPQGQSAAKATDNIFVSLKAWDTDSAKPTITYSNVPIGGSTANKAMWDDGKHVDGSANDTIYGADSMDTVSVVAACEYYALPITIVSAPDTVVTSAPVTVDNSKPILKEMKIEYPPDQSALKTGDLVRIVTNTTDVCIPGGPVKIPIGGMTFVAADLTKIGGKPSEGMYDDGQHGDGAIKDGVYATPEITALSQDASSQFAVPIWGVDIAGNRVVDSTLQVKIDNTPPVVSSVTIQYASGSTAKDGDKVKVQATVTDSGTVNGIYRVYVDASAIGGDVKAPMLGTGTYTSGDITVATGGKINEFKVKVVAIDISGNKGEQEVNVNIDNSATAVKISGLVDNQIIQGTYTFRAVTIDAVQMKINIFGEDRFMAYNVTNGTWEYTVDTNAKSDDAYTVTVTALGKFGTSATDTKAFRIDNTAPSIKITSAAPQSGTYLQGTITFSSSLVDIQDKYLVIPAEFSIDGLGYRPITDVWDTSKVSDGPHTVFFKAVDEAKHVTLAELPLIIDNTPPTAVLVQVPDEKTYITGEQKMLFDAFDAVGMFKVELTFDESKPGEFTVNLPSTGKYYEFTLNTSRFTDGDHTYKITAYDMAWVQADANPSSTYVTKDKHESTAPTPPPGKFKVDNSAPSITAYDATIFDNATPQSGLIILLFTVSDVPSPGSGVAKVEISVDHGNWEDLNMVGGYYNYSWRTGKQDNGKHQIDIRATDKLGHTSVRSFNLSVDNPDSSSMMLALVGVLVFVTLLIFAFLFHRIKAKAIRETPPPPPPQPKVKRSSGGEAQ